VVLKEGEGRREGLGEEAEGVSPHEINKMSIAEKMCGDSGWARIRIAPPS
jgi:hypothetical protein